MIPERLTAAYHTARDALFAERHPDGYWVGELSSSALSTATAVSALSLAPDVPNQSELVERGLRWLADHQNADGGWGDTVKSFSNISTTMLCRAAIHIAGRAESLRDILQKAEAWLTQQYGPTPAHWAEAVRQRYGKDHTFSVPILMNAALARLVPWDEVPALPFEAAWVPQSCYRFVGMPVVSYALPALIAIGQTIFHHKPPRSRMLRWLRRRAVGPTLRVLDRIQPASGGFLEATPLTSFVVMALAACGYANAAESSGLNAPSPPGFAGGEGWGEGGFERPESPSPQPSPPQSRGRGSKTRTGSNMPQAASVIRRGVDFLVNSIRPDGSWPIDSNLSVWVTTLAVNALAAAGDLDLLSDKEKLLAWILEQQETEKHPYTGAAPGGWGWSHLSGSVPDADDTPGAMLAVRHLTARDALSPVATFIGETIGRLSLNELDEPRCTRHQLSGQLGKPGLHVVAGLSWLGGLQNRDGGWPTFCRGWGKLPFDRSGTDLTAHALRAFDAWAVGQSVSERVAGIMSDSLNIWITVDGIPVRLPDRRRMERARDKGLAYLAAHHGPDGSWLPLWFGNQHAPDDINPTYGTAKVLAAYRDLNLADAEPAKRGVQWLLTNQNDDGGWGGGRGTPSSLEETALAVEILLDLAPPESQPAVERGLQWLVERIEAGGLHDPTPIGFYFAKLWYFEKMYPIVFAVAALGRALKRRESYNS